MPIPGRAIKPFALETIKRLGYLRDVHLPVMSRTFARECLVGASFCDLTGFCGYLFAHGYPCQIAHGIVCPGLKGPAAESLLFPERIVSTAFG
jgi:hypothetical protein